jgi:hypothetical protein
MKILASACCLWLILVFGAGTVPANAQVTYTYTGNPFTSCWSTCSGYITGWFTVPTALPPYLGVLTPVTPTAFYFTDNVQTTFTQLSPNLIDSSFSVQTDSTGRLIGWWILFGNGPSAMEVTTLSGGVDISETLVYCTPGPVCNQTYRNNSPGIWTGGGASTALTITTTSLVNGTLGSSYSEPLGATGGTPPYSWSIVSGSLPPGLQLSGGSISGVPNSGGVFNFAVQVKDSAGNTAQGVPLSIQVGAAIIFQGVASNTDVGFYVSGDKNGTYATRQSYLPVVPGSGGLTPLERDFYTEDPTQVNQIVAFSSWKKPTIANVNWDGVVTPTVTMKDPATLPIVFWDLTSAANQSTAQNTARVVSSFADFFYRTQGVGIALPAGPSITRLGPSKVTNCETLGNAGVAWPDSINVYIVDKIVKPNGKTPIGTDCGGGYILINFDSDIFSRNVVLAHELGHELSLEHVDEGYVFPGFDNRNLMWHVLSVPSTDIELSVGQIYRMNFNHDSALNFGIGAHGPDESNDGIQALDIYGNRYPSVWVAPDSSPLHCKPDAPSPTPQTSTATCPAVCKRLWPSETGAPYPACTLEQ